MEWSWEQLRQTLAVKSRANWIWRWLPKNVSRSRLCFWGRLGLGWFSWINADANNPLEISDHQAPTLDPTSSPSSSERLASPSSTKLGILFEVLEREKHRKQLACETQNDRWHQCRDRVLNHTSSESCAPRAYLSLFESDVHLKCCIISLKLNKNHLKGHWKKIDRSFFCFFTRFRTVSLGIFRTEWREVDFQTGLGSSDQTSTAIGTAGLKKLTSWWFQPIWKILVKMGIFPK